MSSGWRESKRPPGRLLEAASLMPATCVPIHETIDYRYDMLQAGYKPLIPKTQNKPLSLNGLHMVLDHTNVANLADRALSSAANQQVKPNKSDLLTHMEIKLSKDRTLDVWHSSPPETTLEQLQSDDTGHSIPDEQSAFRQGKL